MPTVDSSQFTRFKRITAVHRGDTQASDPKSVNRLTQYTSPVSEVSSLTRFVPTPTLKSAQPLTKPPKSVLGKIGLLHQRCA